MNWLDYSCAIQGWMTPGELLWLHNNARGRNTVVEVGVWRGRSLSAIAAAGSKYVFGIDTWESADSTYTQLAPLGQEIIKWEAHQNLAKFPNVELACGTAAKFGPKFGILDMIFIDGSHEYEDVKSDLDALLPKCRPGALICGHDFGMPGVLRAVHERFEGRIVAGEAGSIWSVTCN